MIKSENTTDGQN